MFAKDEWALLAHLLGDLSFKNHLIVFKSKIHNEDVILFGLKDVRKPWWMHIHTLKWFQLHLPKSYERFITHDASLDTLIYTSSLQSFTLPSSSSEAFYHCLSLCFWAQTGNYSTCCFFLNASLRKLWPRYHRWRAAIECQTVPMFWISVCVCVRACVPTFSQVWHK